MGCSKNAGSSQAVSYKKLGSLKFVSHEVCCVYKIIEVGGEVGVGKVAFALALSLEVKPQQCDAFDCQAPADTVGGLKVFGASEAVRKQSIRPGLTFRSLQSCSKLATLCPEKEMSFGCGVHGEPFGLVFW